MVKNPAEKRARRVLGIFFTIVLAAGLAFVLFAKTPSEIITDLNDKKNEIENNYQNNHQPDPIITPKFVLLDVPFSHKHQQLIGLTRASKTVVKKLRS